MVPAPLPDHHVLQQDAPTPPPIEMDVDDIPGDQEEADGLDHNVPVLDKVSVETAEKPQQSPNGMKDEKESVSVAPSSNLNDSDPGSPAVPIKLKKKRVRRLLSDSEDDSEEIRAIKEKYKKTRCHEPKPSVFNLPWNPMTKEARIDIEKIKVPRWAVSANLDKDKIASWNILPKEEFKVVARKWAGLKGDGSQGKIGQRSQFQSLNLYSRSN